MAKKNRTLVFFEKLMDPVGEEIVCADGTVDLRRLHFSGDEAANWAALGEAHGYQLLPAFEIQPPFLPDRNLIERCPNLLALSVSGSGYDIVDVGACRRRVFVALERP